MISHEYLTPHFSQSLNNSQIFIENAAKFQGAKSKLVTFNAFNQSFALILINICAFISNVTQVYIREYFDHMKGHDLPKLYSLNRSYIDDCYIGYDNKVNNSFVGAYLKKNKLDAFIVRNNHLYSLESYNNFSVIYRDFNREINFEKDNIDFEQFLDQCYSNLHIGKGNLKRGKVNELFPFLCDIHVVMYPLISKKKLMNRDISHTIKDIILYISLLNIGRFLKPYFVKTMVPLSQITIYTSSTSKLKSKNISKCQILKKNYDSEIKRNKDFSPHCATLIISSMANSQAKGFSIRGGIYYKPLIILNSNISNKLKHGKQSISKSIIYSSFAVINNHAIKNLKGVSRRTWMVLNMFHQMGHLMGAKHDDLMFNKPMLPATKQGWAKKSYLMASLINNRSNIDLEVSKISKDQIKYMGHFRIFPYLPSA
ncbi:unnamed protein product [Gordionus sp. m RMFG-2023]